MNVVQEPLFRSRAVNHVALRVANISRSRDFHVPLRPDGPLVQLSGPNPQNRTRASVHADPAAVEAMAASTNATPMAPSTWSGKSRASGSG